MAKGIFFVSLILFVGMIVIMLDGKDIKGMVTEYLTNTEGYVCEGNYCYQCTIDNAPCFCTTEVCTCGDKTIDKKMCTVKLLWKEVPKD